MKIKKDFIGMFDVLKGILMIAIITIHTLGFVNDTLPQDRAVSFCTELYRFGGVVVALFFAVLRVGSTTMQAATGVPTSVSDIIQALVIVFSVAGMALTKLPEFQAWRSRGFHGRKAGEA